MAGWNLKEGFLKEEHVSDDELWALFNYVFSDSSAKRNTYKYGLIKALLDNLFNMIECDSFFDITYHDIFSKFAENYWNLIVKYDLRQMRPDGRSFFSKIETIFMEETNSRPMLAMLEFDTIDQRTRDELIIKVTNACKKNVIGALYEDFDGKVYSFNLAASELHISKVAYNFMIKYKYELEKMNYYSWAKFLETVNNDDKLIKVLSKLELATPHRSNLSIYRDILYKEFEQRSCFYCGRRLVSSAHVDHFIPWSFVKDDKIWNFVLVCPTCNSKKNNKLPKYDSIPRILIRNGNILKSENNIIASDFRSYKDDLLYRMWDYARLSGFKEYIDE